MSGPWVDFDTIKGKVADVLSKKVLEPKWDSIIADSIQASTGEIVRQFIGRGLTAAQADQWDDRVEYSIDVTMYWVFCKGDLTGASPDKFAFYEGRRKELKTVPILISGVRAVAPPQPVGSGVVASGNLSQCGYRFNMRTEF